MVVGTCSSAAFGEAAKVQLLQQGGQPPQGEFAMKNEPLSVSGATIDTGAGKDDIRRGTGSYG